MSSNAGWVLSFPINPLYLWLNPFLANVPNLYPLKTPSQCSGVFRGITLEDWSEMRYNIRISV